MSKSFLKVYNGIQYKVYSTPPGDPENGDVYFSLTEGLSQYKSTDSGDMLQYISTSPAIYLSGGTLLSKAYSQIQDITYTAVTSGTEGNLIGIEYITSGGVFTISVVDSVIKIYSGDVQYIPASFIVSEINSHAQASLLVYASPVKGFWSPVGQNSQKTVTISSGPYEASPFDQIIVYNISSPVSIILPTSVKSGDVVTIIDGGPGLGIFSAYPLTVLTKNSLITIQGQSSLTVSRSGLSVKLMYTNLDWRIL